VFNTGSADLKISINQHQIFYPVKYADQSHHRDSVEGYLVGQQRIFVTENLTGRVNLKSPYPMTKSRLFKGLVI
jgi:hypothetical protein